MAEDDGFLSRWSRRKIAEKQREEVALPELPETLEEDAAEPEDAPIGALPEETETAPERHPAEDIDIDSLTKDSDFTIFMQKGVSSALRRKALRKLWTSDPVLANLDGLNDYEDMEWTYGISETAQTDWKLGRGFLNDKDLGLEAAEEDTDEEGVSAQEDAPHDPDEGVPVESVADAEPEDEAEPPADADGRSA